MSKSIINKEKWHKMEKLIILEIESLIPKN